jgi:hypothetical protein
VLPVNIKDGAAAVPAGNCNVPVIVSPAFNTLSDAAPIKLATMVPALKLPDESRRTMVFAAFKFVAVVAEFATKPDAVKVANLPLAIAAFEAISALVINELEMAPLELLCKIPAVVNGVIVNVLLITSSVTLIIPAAKLPDASRFTSVLAVSKLVAAFAAAVAAATFAAVWPPTVLTTVALCVPVTSPLNDPVKFVELVAVVAVVALPLKFAVIVPAAKLPDASRFTSVLTVSALVAAFAAVVAVATFAAVWPPTVLTTVALCVPVTSPLNDPVKFVAVVAVVAVVALVAFPVKFAVIVPAEKLPDESRATIVLAVFPLVAVVAEFATNPDAVNVANLPLAIAAFEAISEFTINELDKLPEASL